MTAVVSGLLVVVLISLFVGNEISLLKSNKQNAQMIYWNKLIAKADQAVDVLYEWEDQHPNPWLDGYCEHYRTLIFEAIEACQLVRDEVVSLTNSAAVLIDALQARLELDPEPPPDTEETSPEVSFYLGRLATRLAV